MMPTRILVVGGGGREHALAWKLANEPGVNDVIVAPGSDAIGAEPRVRSVPADPSDGAALVDIARAAAVELAIIGPEAPLAAGVADELRSAGIATFGPSAAAARIESSKAFCRAIAEAAGVRMGRGRAFAGPATARRFAAELAASGAGVVVKADGLAGGKGVTVCGTADAAHEAIDRLFETGGRGRVVVEERLTGREASLVALTDGRDVLALPAARDHKRLHDGDEGPNTGGMGGYSPLPDVPDEAAEALLDAFHRPILAELARRGTPFMGALYAGLMLTPDGPALLECNARLGDPETQLVLPRLGVALGPLALAAARGELAGAARRLGLGGSLLPVTPDASVAIVLASDGYPGPARAGQPIVGLELAERMAAVFHAGTRRSPGGGYVTTGGRVLSVVGRGSTLAAARAVAEEAAEAIAFDGCSRRHDIAADPPEPVDADVALGLAASGVAVT